MGKSAGILGAIGFAVIGGFVGGLFAPGAFSMLGASIGFSVGGAALAKKPKFQQSKPDVLPDNGEIFVRQFAGTVQQVNPRIIRVGKDKKGNPAGVFVRSQSSGGKGGTSSSQTYLLMCEFEIGRAMAPDALHADDEFADESPEPLFVDLLEIDGADGRETIYDRDGDTDEKRGLEMTQNVSSITGRVISETSTNGKVTFFTGTDEQMPYAPMEEFYDDGLPADRGIAKISFNRYPVKSPPTFYVTVRSGTNGRRELLTLKFGEREITPARLVLDAIPEDSVFEGVSIENYTPLREFAESATRRLFCDWAFDGARLVVQSRLNPTVHVVDMRRVGVWRDSGQGDEGGQASSDDGRLVLRARAQTEMCSEVVVAFRNSNQNGEDDKAPAPQSRAIHQNVMSYDLGEVASMQDATKFAYALRDEDWNADEEGQFSVLPGCEDWLSGDVVTLERGKSAAGELLPTRDYLLVEIEREGGGIQNPKIVPYAAHVYSQSINVVGPIAPHPGVLVPAAPYLGVADCVALSDSKPRDQTSEPGVLFWIAQSRVNKQKMVTWRTGTASSADEYGRGETRANATCGELTASFEVGVDTSISLKSIRGELTNASSAQYRKGGNVMVFDSGLVLQFTTVVIDDYDSDADEIFYTVSGLSRPRYGSEYASGELAIGAKWVLFKNAAGEVQDGVFWDGVSSKPINKSLRVSALVDGENGALVTDYSFTYRARNMEALAPVVVEASRGMMDNLRLRGRYRSRYADDNYQSDAALHRMSETPTPSGYKYRVTLTDGTLTKTLELYSTDDRASYDFTVSSATLTTLFGSAPSTLSGSISIQGKFGFGREAAFVANV